MDEEYFMNLCKAAQLHSLSKKSKDIFNMIMDFEYEGGRSLECEELKNMLTNAFLLGYNCGIDKLTDKELEKNL